MNKTLFIDFYPTTTILESAYLAHIETVRPNSIFTIPFRSSFIISKLTFRSFFQDFLQLSLAPKH